VGSSSGREDTCDLVRTAEQEPTNGRCARDRAAADTWNVVRDGSLSGLRTTFRRIAITAATAALVVAAPPVFAADAAFTSFPVPIANAGLAQITRGPDGAMWFTGRGTGLVGRVSDEGVFVTYSLPDPTSGPTGIASGLDGALWVTLSNAEAIGRVDPAGGFETYPLPADEGSPVGIALGPDGAMWFAERAGDRIGRIDPSTGAITEFPVGTVSGPTSIVTGPDGGLWFTGSAVDALGRLDPVTGATDRIDLPADSMPSGVAAADGALWVTLRGTDQIARVTPDGTIDLYDAGEGSAPTEIAADGANGVVWFTARGTDRLVRLAFDGTMTPFEAEADAGLSGIAVDADGRPWVTQRLQNSIGLLDLATAPPDTTAPTVSIASPSAGAWTVRGTGGLTAAYGCADEGGSGLATCEGTVADGASVPDGALGTSWLAVHAADGAGNTTDAAVPYLVFGSASGSVLGGTSTRAGEGLTLELGMDLPAKAAPLARAVTTPVSCSTGEPAGPAEAADVRTRVTHLGELSLRWDTARTWAGQCRTLTLTFSADGWTSADAVFGPIGIAQASKGR
jgi:virginiamycin B lyase